MLMTSKYIKTLNMFSGLVQNVAILTLVSLIIYRYTVLVQTTITLSPVCLDTSVPHKYLLNIKANNLTTHTTHFIHWLLFLCKNYSIHFHKFNTQMSINIPSPCSGGALLHAALLSSSVRHSLCVNVCTRWDNSWQSADEELSIHCNNNVMSSYLYL